ncbi:hypothetical protein [Actinomadura vinacea]|uniref:hypothetical protein n=1 Tax=Actinomadura vinacea TaxID=115336 RepID=UPI0031D39F10
MVVQDDHATTAAVDVVEHAGGRSAPAADRHGVPALQPVPAHERTAQLTPPLRVSTFASFDSRVLRAIQD